MKEYIHPAIYSNECDPYFKSVLEVSPMGIVTLDFDGRVVCWSKAAEKLFGWKAEEIIGKFHPVVYRDRKGSFLNNLRRVFNNEVNRVNEESYHLTKCGDAVSVAVSASRLTDTRGNTIGVIGVHEDLTQKMHDRKKLLKTVYSYRSLLESISDGFVIFDSNLMINYVNKSFARMLEYRESDLFATKITDYMLGSRENLDTSDLGANSCNQVWITRSGRRLHTVVSPGSKNCISGSRIVRSIIVTDISEIRESQARLRSNEREMQMGKKHLEEVNIALKILLEQRENDKKNLEENMVASINNMVLPLITRLENKLTDDSKILLRSVHQTLKEIASPFYKKFIDFNFTPTELQVATYIKQGMQTKEIADLMNLSSTTIEEHRKHIRRKLGISGEKANLRLKLLSMDKE